jgi:hypothetical protein
MSDTPTSRVIGDANANAIVEDARGRRLSLRFPSSFLRMRLARYIGAELQSNAEWWGNAIVALSVTSIDDVPCLDARNPEQVEGTILRLDDDGMFAVANWLKSESEKKSELAAAAKN